MPRKAEEELIKVWLQDHLKAPIAVLSEVTPEMLPAEPIIVRMSESGTLILTPRDIFRHLIDPESPLRRELLQMIRETVEWRETHAKRGKA